MTRCQGMGRRCWLPMLVALLLGAPLTAAAQGVLVRSDTLFRFFERDTAATADSKVAPLYEYLQLDYGGYTGKGLTVHAYGWGRADLGDGGYYRDDHTGQLLYAYLQYSQPFSNFNLRLGRQQVMSGVVNASLDGLSLSSDLGPYFAVSACGGLPVAYDTSAGRSGDALFGGRLAHHWGTHYELGVSYLQSADDGEKQRQRLGADLTFGLPGGISFDGRSVYNLESEGFAEQVYQLRFGLGSLSVRPYYEQYDFRDQFETTSQTPNPFRILAGSKEALSAWGADLAWGGFADWELGARVRQLDYDLNAERAAYYALLLTWHGAKRTQIGAEAGTLQGDAVGNDTLLGRLYFYLDGSGRLQGTFLSGDACYTNYEQPFFGVDRSWSASLGTGLRFLKDALEVRLAGDYSSDPNYDSDWRGTLALSYRFGQ